MASGATFPVVADPRVTFNCGWISCSAYLSRKATKTVYKNSIQEYGLTGPTVYALMVTKLCARFGPSIAGFACEGILLIYAYTIGDRLTKAANEEKCLRIKYRFVGLLNVEAYVDNSGFCHDN